jgi:hypothetical protein
MSTTRRRASAALVVVLVLGLLAAFWLVGRFTPTASGSTVVPWSDYAPSLQRQVDAMGAAGDCLNLHALFDQLYEDNAATIGRTGHTNVALMLYIYGAMGSAGCYR